MYNVRAKLKIESTSVQFERVKCYKNGEIFKIQTKDFYKAWAQFPYFNFIM